MNNTLQQQLIYSLKEYKGTAIKCCGRTLTFENLNSMTDNIAANLASNGIRSGNIVCVKMKRTENMMAAMLGVVKSGATLLPIQDATPEKRFKTIMDAVAVSMIITDDNFDMMCAKPENPDVDMHMAKEDDIALILFTSGSTGKPKGVCHTQYSCISTAKQFPSELKNVGISDEGICCTIAKTEMSYISAYFFEYMPLIASGIPMILLTEEEMNSTEIAAKVISENPGCSIFLTPSQADNYLRQGALRNENLRCLILAGEPLLDATRKAIIESLLPDTSVVSYYGSTECHLITLSNCRDWDNTCGVVCDNYDVEILDSEDVVCGNGIDGNIVVCGPGVFRNYIGADDRRIDISGNVYSYTGDYGEKTADGRVIIKGRTDRMIKYHGLRVELGDIENNISQYPGIGAVAVTEADTEAGTTVLCAYYESDREIDIRELRKFLMERLSVSMVPSGFIKVDKLPRNNREKIDYQELRKRVFVPDDEKISSELKATAYQAAAAICQAIKGLLSLQCDVNPDDNLFKLGMDSIQAYNLIGELEKSGYTTDINQIFMNPIISDLANAMSTSDVSTESTSQSIDTQREYTATVEQAFWFINLEQFKYFGFYISDCFVCGKTYTQTEFETRVNEIVDRHPAFTADIKFNEGMPTQVLSKTPVVISTYTDISEMGNGAPGNHGINDEQRQFIDEYIVHENQKVLADEKIIDFKATYFAIDKDTGVILVTCNHSSSDGSSMNIIRGEFLMDKLPEGKDSYPQYLQYISDMNNVGEAMQFWMGYLKGAEPSSFTSIGSFKDPNHVPEFRSYTIKLEKDDMEMYKDKCASDGVSPAGYANYAYGKALLETQKKSRIIFQMLTAGRGIPVKGISKAVGCILEKISVVMSKELTPVEFQKQYMQCDRYSFLAPAMIWQPITGSYEAPEMAPHLVSEVFPPVSSDVYCRDNNHRDYDSMMESNFITMDENEFNVYFHYDINSVPEEEILEVIKATEEIIKNYR